MIEDDRQSEAPEITWGLIADVLQVLEDHGYCPPTDTKAGNRARGVAALAIDDLIKAYTGHSD